MRSVTLTKTLAAASATNIALSQSPAGAGNLTLNGAAVVAGVAKLDTQRRVLITSAGTDTGITFTVYGGNQSGSAISETVAGGSLGIPVSTTQDFLTVTRVAASGASASTVTVGTSGVGSSPWANPSVSITPFVLPIVTVVTGSVTYSVETTKDEFWVPGAPAPSVQATAITTATTASNETIGATVRGWRLTVTAGTGTVTATATQAGITNY